MAKRNRNCIWHCGREFSFPVGVPFTAPAIAFNVSNWSRGRLASAGCCWYAVGGGDGTGAGSSFLPVMKREAITAITMTLITAPPA